MQSIAFAPEEELQKVRLNKKQKHGHVYCFVPNGDANIIKVGRANDWKDRGYMGLNKPKEVIFVETVPDQRRVEAILKKFLSSHVDFQQRYDLGKEWFQTKLSPTEVKRILLPIVQMLM